MIYTVLKGKTVLVSGAGSGMGKVTAKLFAKAGAEVAVVEINKESGQNVANEILAEGGSAIFVQANIADSESVRHMVDTIVAKYGKLDAAVNNAGIELVTGPTQEFDDEKFDKQIAINLKGTANCMKYEMKQMIKQKTGGSIVNLGSCCTNKAVSGMLGYTASKWGVRGMSQVAAVDGGPYGIRVNSICPGTVMTPMAMKYFVDNQLDPNEDAKFHTSIGRYAQPEEIAQVSMFLISDNSSYISGANINIDACESIM